MSSTEPPGSQVARTTLAWQRTALSVLVATLVVVRLTLDELKLAALGVLVVALTLSTSVLVLCRRGSLRGAGLAAAALATAIGLLCLAELAAVLA